MGYKHESMAGNGERTTAMLSKTQVNLKLIPGVDGGPSICQLVAYNLTEIIIKGSWIGPGRLHLVPHVNAPVAEKDRRRASLPCRPHAPLRAGHLRLSQGGGLSAGPRAERRCSLAPRQEKNGGSDGRHPLQRQQGVRSTNLPKMGLWRERPFRRAYKPYPLRLPRAAETHQE
jgi:hypothetical protein